MKRQILFLLIVFSAFISISAQQTKQIYGTVTDSKTGDPLIGAVVREDGTQNATVTDLDGNYKLTLKASRVALSYIGYTPKTMDITDNGRYDVNLAPIDQTLGEVVVVGYGSMKKSDLTGSLSSVSGKDLKNMAETNVSEMLAGKASGVFVAASSGQPGSDAIVRVRGLGTVNDNNPLYVVDGQFMDNISSINPADIERMEILKDASSCAIYGSRGSNGVILITTKNGESGKTNIAFNAFVGVKNSCKALDMMNSDQYYKFITTAYADDASFQNSMLQKFTNQYKKGYNTDWWKEVTRTALTQNYNFSVSRGTDNSRTYLSAGYVDDQGTLITTYYRRMNANLKQEYNLNRYVTVGTNITVSSARKRDAGQLPSFNFIQKADPFTPVINPLVDASSEDYDYNKYAPTEWSFDPNPVSLLRLPNRHNDILNVFGNAYVEVKLLKGLTYRGQYSFERYRDDFTNFIPFYSATFSEDNLANKESKYNTQTKLTENSDNISNYIIENRLNYNAEFGKNALDAMFAITYEKNNEKTVNSYKRGALGDDESYQVLDAQTTGDQTSGTKIITSMMSYLGRVNYVYDEKYLLTASFRADGSSRFAKGNRWGFFPSMALGWRINNENFFKNWNIDNVVSNAKLRVGWGENGNQRINRKAALTLIGTNNEKQWNFGSTYSQGYVPTYTGNPDVKWEKDRQANIGLDLGFFGNSLNVTLDYYVKKTTDMLLQVPIPEFGSYANDPFFNAGDLKNTGFDMSVNYQGRINRDLTINAGANISTYKTKVTRLTSDYLTGNVSRTYVGGPIGRFWGYKQIGIFQNQAEIDNYVDKDGNKIQPNAKPGDFKFEKLGKGGALNDDEDRTFIGDPNPDLIFGFNVGVKYRDFDLSMYFQGTAGNDIYNTSRGALAIAGLQNALADAYTKAWTKEGDNATYPRMTNQDTNNNYRVSSFYVEDGSYLRLQNIQLGYNIPQSLCKKWNVFSSCRIYASAQNLFTITGYSGLDPEIGVDNALNTGVDETRYPTCRTFTLGINLQF
jgi:TonB-linked SusC/RagA family outer membrane protein